MRILSEADVYDYVTIALCCNAVVRFPFFIDIWKEEII